MATLLKKIFQRHNNVTMKQCSNGFTLVELMVVIGIMLIFLTLLTPNLFNFQQKASLDSTSLTLIADIRLAQAKAMSGDTEGRGTNDSYGMYFETGRYILFHGTSYNPGDADNYPISLGDQIEISSTTFPSSQVVFQKGSGEVDSYIDGSDSVTLRNTQTGEQKTIQLNRYGIVRSVN